MQEDQEEEEEVEAELDDAEARVNARMDMVEGNEAVGPAGAPCSGTTLTCTR